MGKNLATISLVANSTAFTLSQRLQARIPLMQKEQKVKTNLCPQWVRSGLLGLASLSGSNASQTWALPMQKGVDSTVLRALSWKKIWLAGFTCPEGDTWKPSTSLIGCCRVREEKKRSWNIQATSELLYIWTALVTSFPRQSDWRRANCFLCVWPLNMLQESLPDRACIPVSW